MQLSRFEDCMQNVACWASLLKILFWDGTGLCLFTKRMDHGSFWWPRTAEPGGSVTLTPAQLAMLKDSSMEGFRRLKTASVHSDRSPLTSLIEPQTIFVAFRMGDGGITAPETKKTAQLRGLRGLQIFISKTGHACR